MPKLPEKREVILVCETGHQLIMSIYPKTPTATVCLTCNTPLKELNA